MKSSILRDVAGKSDAGTVLGISNSPEVEESVFQFIRGSLYQSTLPLGWSNSARGL